MFQTIIVQPIYNVLVALYGILPGHDLGVSLIIFTVLIRLLMWPLLKKQLHQSKVMQELQPELTRVKKAAAGDRQKEATMMMELYKEKGVSPFGSIGLTILQLPLFIGVFDAARDLSEHIDKLGSTTYSFVRSIPHVHSIISDPSRFNFKSFGFLDLSQKAFTNGHIYIPVIILAIAATVFTYIQSKQIMPVPKEKKRLRDILKASNQGNHASQEDMTAAMSGTMLYIMPVMTLLFCVYSPGAMIMYLLASSLIGIYQQSLIFKKDTDEMEAEVVSVKKTPEAKTLDMEVDKTLTKKDTSEAKINKKGKVVTKTRIITPGASASMHNQAKSSSRKKRRKR